MASLDSPIKWVSKVVCSTDLWVTMDHTQREEIQNRFRIIFVSIDKAGFSDLFMERFLYSFCSSSLPNKTAKTIRESCLKHKNVPWNRPGASRWAFCAISWQNSKFFFPRPRTVYDAFSKGHLEQKGSIFIEAVSRAEFCRVSDYFWVCFVDIYVSNFRFWRIVSRLFRVLRHATIRTFRNLRFPRFWDLRKYYSPNEFVFVSIRWSRVVFPKLRIMVSGVHGQFH